MSNNIKKSFLSLLKSKTEKNESKDKMPKKGEMFTLPNGQKAKVQNVKMSSSGHPLVLVTMTDSLGRRMRRWVRAFDSEVGTRADRVRNENKRKADKEKKQEKEFRRRSFEKEQQSKFMDMEHEGKKMSEQITEEFGGEEEITRQKVEMNRAEKERLFRLQYQDEVAITRLGKELEQRPITERLSEDMKKFFNPNFDASKPESEFNPKYFDAFKHQIEGAERILTELQTKDGMLLQDQAGLGKTTTALLTVKKKMKVDGVKRTLIVVPTRGRKNLIESWKNEGKAHGIEISDNIKDAQKKDGVYVVSYNQLPELDKAEFEYSIYDECHNMANQTSTAKNGKAVMRNTDKVLYMSATPYTDVSDMHYMIKTGLFEDDEEGNGFQNFKEKWGVRKKKGETENEFIKRKLEKLQKLSVYAELSGYTLQRETNLKGLETIFGQTTLTEDQRRVYELGSSLFGMLKDVAPTGILKMQMGAAYAGWYRHFLEYTKIPSAVALAKKAISEGKQPGIFSAYNVGGKTFARGAINTLLNKLSDPENSYAMNKADLQILAGRLNGIFQQLPNLPPITKEIVRRLGGSDVVAEVHGNTDKDTVSEQKQFQKGTKKVLVASMAKGGTGMSFNDQRGDAPRVQINMTFPYSDKEFHQVAGRMHRLTKGERSTEMYWLSADTPSDARLANIIGGRLLTGNAMVSGNPLATLSSAPLYHGGDFNPDRGVGEIEDFDWHGSYDFVVGTGSEVLQKFQSDVLAESGTRLENQQEDDNS